MSLLKELSTITKYLWAGSGELIIGQMRQEIIARHPDINSDDIDAFISENGHREVVAKDELQTDNDQPGSQEY